MIISRYTLAIIIKLGNQACNAIVGLGYRSTERRTFYERNSYLALNSYKNMGMNNDDNYDFDEI